MESAFELSRSLTGSSLVQQVSQRFPTAPLIVPRDAPVGALPAIIAANRDCQTIAVVDNAGVLVGIIPVDDVIEHLLLRVMPEEFLADLREPEKAAELMREQHARTAGDLMRPPLSVPASATVREAFHKIHHAEIMGLPVVDEGGRVTGYIGLLHLLLSWLS